MRSLEICTQKMFNNLIKQNQKLTSGFVLKQSMMVSSAQTPASKVYRQESRVQGTGSSVQSPESSVQHLRPESRNSICHSFVPSLLTMFFCINWLPRWNFFPVNSSQVKKIESNIMRILHLPYPLKSFLVRSFKLEERYCNYQKDKYIIATNRCLEILQFYFGFYWKKASFNFLCFKTKTDF